MSTDFPCSALDDVLSGRSIQTDTRDIVARAEERNSAANPNSRAGASVVEREERKLTNMRPSTSDERICLVSPCLMSLEQGLELLAEDELFEDTPTSLRLRKKILRAVRRR